MYVLRQLRFAVTDEEVMRLFSNFNFVSPRDLSVYDLT